MKRLAIALVLLTVAASAPALAQDKATASALFKEGNALRKEKKYPAALEKYQEAYRIYPSFKIQYNIAVTLQYMGRYAEAVTVYQRFLREGIGKSPEALVHLTKKKILLLRSEIAVVAVRCGLDGATVILDGKEEGKSPLGRDLYLAPGKHTLQVAHAGYEPYQEDFTVEAGQRKEVSVTLVEKPEEPEKPEPMASPPPVVSPVKPVEPEAVQSDIANLLSRRQVKTMWAWSTLAVSAACVVTAGALYGIGIPAGDEAHENYNNATDIEDIQSYREDVENAQAKVIAGHVLAGVAGAALVASVVLFATRPEAPMAANSLERPLVSLSPSPGGAAALFSGSF